MNIIEVKVSDIRPYEKNNKKHPQEQIEDVATSIKQFGFKQPLVLDKDNVIIIGHCRFEAAKLLGLETVPCVIASDLDEEKVRKLRIADNKTNESDWDFDNLVAELEDLSFDEFNFEFSEFITDSDGEEIEVVEDDYSPITSETPKSKLGDIYKLGNHTLMCGDSTSKEDVDKLVGGGVNRLFIYRSSL